MTQLLDMLNTPPLSGPPDAAASTPETTHARAMPDGLHIIIPHARLPFCLGSNEGDIEVLDSPAFAAVLANRLNARPATLFDDAEAIIECVVDDIRADDAPLPSCLALIPDE